MPALPAIVRGETRHKRHTPFVHDIRVPQYLWLIDLDETPRMMLGTFSPKDHFGGEAKTIKDAVIHFARSVGEEVAPTDRFVMLAAPRSLGHVFNPLSVHYCITETNEIRFAILEVHNTYGGRHCYLLHPADNAEMTTEKAFYVSPFFEVYGTYHVKLRLDAEKIVSVVNLHQNDSLVFSASFIGVAVPPTLRNRALAALRYPLANYQTSLRIKFHGIWLWAKKLPVIKRTNNVKQEGML
ncbi:MAG: hypothetical protein RIS43_435 [Actinomycetota bacterium]